MEVQRPRWNWFDLGWLLAWGFASSVWCVTAASQLSATFDEPFYLKCGIESWRDGSYYSLLRAGTMPLPIDVETLPIHLWERWRGQPFHVEADFDRLLPVARAGNLLFWWVLLIYGWKLASCFAGAWAGRLTVLLLACEPNLLAHACLATTDIAVSACMLAFTYHFWMGRDQSWWKRIAIPSLWYGLAILAKASALVFGPLVMIALEGFRLLESGALHAAWAFPATTRMQRIREGILGVWALTGTFRREFVRTILLGLVIVFAYCRTEFKAQRSFVKWANQLPESTLRTVMVPLSENLRIFPNAGEGLMYQIKHNFRGHGVYLFGNWERRAIWYYFPTAMLIKFSIPVLLLTAALFLTSRRAMLTPIGMITLFLFLFTLNCRVQIGIRLILPFVAYLMTCLAVALVRAVPVTAAQRVFPLATAGLAVTLAIPPLMIWPHGLAYINQLWGGPREGYRYLSDSNYDWGQGLKELARWQQEHADTPLRIWYYGTDPRSKSDPAFVALHGQPFATEAEVEAALRGSRLAVATSILHNNPQLTPSTSVILRYLQKHQPIARTMTFFIYDFTDGSSVARLP